MSPEKKILRKKKKLNEKKNLPVEINGESNFDFDSMQQQTLKKTTMKKMAKNSKEKKSGLNSKKKKNAGDRPNSDHDKISTQFKTLKEDGNSEKPTKTSNETKIKTKKAKKEMKQKKKDSIAEERRIEQTLDLVDEGNVEEISSVDEDCSRGMKKWLIKYKESRPGLNILQERIDDFITVYEEQQEQERKEREARAAEGGWTVVVHHKGRKKTTEVETGVTVGSVAQAAVVDKMGKKKSKEVSLDFYRFKKREALRNEIMMQHNKFDQDKKRIQQLRSARKFRPY